jgi:uncharacterized protein YjdB
VPIISVRVTPTSPTLYTGQTQQFTATVIDSLQQVVTDRRVVWSTTDRGTVLAVDSLTGLATAVAPSGVGTTITASVETVPGFPALDFQRGSTGVSVLAPAANARVVNASGVVVSSTTLRVGASQQVTLQALDAVGTSLAGRQYRVTSDTPASPRSRPLGSSPRGARRGRRRSPCRRSTPTATRRAPRRPSS